MPGMSPRGMPLAVLAVLSIFVAFCLFALSTGSFTVLAFAAVLPFALLLVVRADLLAVVICCLYYSSIRIPGMPGGRQLYEMLMVAFFVLSGLSYLLSKRRSAPSWPLVWAFLFLVVLCVTMVVRGMGFQSIGGSKWGGGRYLQLIPCVLFFLASDAIDLSPRQWRIAVTGMMLFSLLPGMWELLYKVSGGAVVAQYYIFTPAATTVQAYSLGDPETMVRFAGFIPGCFVFMLPFLRYRPTGVYLLAYAGFMALSLVVIGLTGHRLNLVMMVLYIWFYLYIKARNRWLYLLLSLAVLAVLAVILGFLACYLPQNFQRVLSVIPYARVSPDVYTDARGTSVWRVMVWKEAVKDIPRYLWIGKGYAYDSDAFISAMRSAYRSEYHNLVWALLSGSYHQGVLSLLLGMGVGGLVSGMAFLVSILCRHLQVMRGAWTDESMRRIHFGLFVMMVVMAVTYVFIYGDSFVSFPGIFFFSALLEGLRRRQEQDAAALPKVPQPSSLRLAAEDIPSRGAEA